MYNHVLRIATRKSPLAMWQARYVAQLLNQYYPRLKIEFVELVTQGDKWLETPLYDLGGKALFLNELEQALLNNKADIAVHSMKDVPSELPEGLVIETILDRGNPYDVLISKNNEMLTELAANSVIGTSSLRRLSQIKCQRPDLIYKSLRGNVGTRLDKLDSGQYDAIILAKAGLVRLNLQSRITQIFSEQQCLPGVGQGAIGIESRKDVNLLTLLRSLNHKNTACCVIAERAFNQTLGSDCHSPVAAFAQIEGNIIKLTGGVFAIDGSQQLVGTIDGHVNEPKSVGKMLAQQLLTKGAFRLLNQNKHIE